MVRYPLRVVDENAIRRLDETAPLRLAYQGLLADLDDAAARLLGDEAAEARAQPGRAVFVRFSALLPGYPCEVRFSHALRSVLPGPNSRCATTPNGTARHPISITTASVSLEDQHRVRVRKYAIVALFRMLAFVLSGVAYGLLGNPWVAVAIICIALPMPWIVALFFDDLPPWE